MVPTLFTRAVVLGALVAGLAACCAQPPLTQRPPPGAPPEAGRHGGPPPHGRRGPPPPPDPLFQEAMAACAVELKLPEPGTGGSAKPPPLDQEQRDLLEVCLEEKGVERMPPPWSDDSAPRP